VSSGSVTSPVAIISPSGNALAQSSERNIHAVILKRLIDGLIVPHI